MNAHSKAPISSAARIVGCNGSVSLESRVPEEDDSQEAREGDAMHWAGAKALNQLREFKQSALIQEGQHAPNGVILTGELAEAANFYVDTVVELIGSDATERLNVELPVAAPAIHAECYGTTDAAWWNIGHYGAIVHCVDFKGGHGFVDAFENWQGIGYLAGILSRPEFANISRTAIECNFHIVQPRNYMLPTSPRTWTILADKLAPFFDRLETSYAAAFGPNPLCVVNDECRYCRARHICQTLHIATGKAMDFAGTATPLEMSDGALSTELFMLKKAKDIMQARLTGLEEDAVSRIRNSKLIPGWSLQPGQAREQWTVDPSVVFETADALGVDVRKPATPITPKQARDKGLDADVVGAFSARPAGALKLTAIDEKQLRKVFP